MEDKAKQIKQILEKAQPEFKKQILPKYRLPRQKKIKYQPTNKQIDFYADDKLVDMSKSFGMSYCQPT